MDENANNQNIQQPSEKDIKKAKAQQAGKDLAEVAAKGAATYFGGPVGGAVANKIVNSKLGQKTLNNIGKDLSKKRLTRNFLADSQPAISKAKPALDTVAGNLGGLKGGSKASSSTSKSYNSTDSVNKTSSNSSTDSKSNFGQKKTLLGSDNLNNTTETDDGSIDISKNIFNFFKKNPGILFSIAFFFFAMLIPVFIILLIASLVMYVIDAISNFATGVGDFFQSLVNFVTLNGWNTDQNVYINRMDEGINLYFNKDGRKVSNIDEASIRYYVNAATFYSNVVDPEVLAEVYEDPDNVKDGEKPTEEEENKDKENVEQFTQTFVGNADDLKAKYSSVKYDPTDLINNMFNCTTSGESEICTFSEDKYREYLEKTYVPKKYINCDSCEFKSSTDSEKEAAAKQMANEIISQAKSSGGGYGADDESNEAANTLTSSGITVKDREGNVIGTYSVVEYVQIIVERDASEYSDEVKKAYALNIISKLLSNSSNTEITENDFNPEMTITDSTKKAVDSVKNLKIMKNGKIYYGSFNFEKAKTVEPQEYVAILKALFGEDISIEESISDGLQQDPATGFYMRVEPPSNIPGTDSYENYFGSRNHGYIGECAWYATDRAREITETMSLPNIWTANANGSGFCDLHKNQFERCYPGNGKKCEIKQGTIISWKGLYGYCDGPYGCGHVAIVEQVNSDGTYLISDAAVTKGGYARANNIKYVGDYTENYVQKKGMWSYINNGSITRLDNCLYDKGVPYNGCVSIKNWDRNTIETYLDGVRCYIYLED